MCDCVCACECVFKCVLFRYDGEGFPLSLFFNYCCDHLHCYHGDDSTQGISHLNDPVTADGSYACDEAVELVELLL